MAQGDLSAARGDVDAARQRYAEVARLEVEALSRIPEDRLRTRGAIAVGVVSLYRKAGLIDDAIEWAHRLLSQRDHPVWTRSALEAQLDEIKSERRASDLGYELTPHVFVWSLKGPAILEGEGPIGIVLQKIDQVMKYGTRVGEYLAGYPLRRMGAPTRQVREFMGMTLSEPMPGSFRFRVRLLRSTVQTDLFAADHPLPSAEDIASTYINIVRAAAEPESNRLQELVHEPDYQEAFLQLVRSIAPDGKQVSSVEVESSGPQRRVTRLSHHTAESIRDHVLSLNPGVGEEEEELEDVLRALDLNRGWIILGEKSETRCYVDKESPVLEDVVGPLVNRRVRVRTYRKGAQRVIRDIEPIDSENA